MTENTASEEENVFKHLTPGDVSGDDGDHGGRDESGAGGKKF
jgi:hypothetical protein